MKYYCKKCGQEFSEIRDMVFCTCSNGGKHEPYMGHESGPYHCRKCGQQYSEIRDMVFCTCPFGGKHEPLE